MLRSDALPQLQPVFASLDFHSKIGGMYEFINRNGSSGSHRIPAGAFKLFLTVYFSAGSLYIGYLAGGAQTVDADGSIRYPRKKVLLNTLFFILGIGFAFVLLGFGFTALGKFFSGNRIWFVRIGGIIMVLFGLYQLGVFGRANVIEREHKLPFRLDKWAMSPLVALVLGFTFSFAWTPLRGTGIGQCTVDGIVSQFLSIRFSADRSLYAGVCTTLSGGGILLPARC